MRIKEGVILVGLQIVMRPALVTADKVWRQLGQELVVTSGLDGTHSAGSLHYYGLALDFRTRYFTKDEQKTAVMMLKQELPDYDVVLHSSHIHVEYDSLR